MNNYKNLSRIGARDNMGGASVRLLFAPIDYFVSGGIKKKPLNPINPEAAVTIAESHQFRLGKGFHTIRAILDTNKLKADPVGERGGRGIKQEYEAKVSGNTKLMAYLMALMKNDEFIILVPTHDGLYIQLGSEDLPAEMLPSHDTGTIESGVNSMMVKITEYTLGRTFYGGAIQELTDETFEASVAFSTVTDGDSVNINLDGNTIATAVAGASDTPVDFMYKLLTSAESLGEPFGVNPILSQGVLTFRTFPIEGINWEGEQLTVENLVGTPTVSSTVDQQTFTSI